MPREPFSKGEKFLFGTSLLAFFALAGAGVFFKIRDAEPDWNALLKPTTPLPKPNGFDFYLASALSTVRFTPEIDPASDRTIRTNAEAKHFYSLKRRKAWVRANAKAFALFDRGLQTPSQAFADDFKNYGRLRQLARDNMARVNTLKMEDKPFEATMLALDGVQMGEDISRDGALVPRLVGVAIGAISRSPIEDWNQTINKLNANEAKIAAQRAEKILGMAQPFSQTLENEEQSALREWKRHFSRSDWRAGETWQERLNNQFVSKRRIVQQIKENHARAIQQSTRPYSQSREESAPDNVGFLGQSSSASFLAGGIRNEYRSQISMQMLMLRLALRSYIAQNGRAPKTLAQLSPSILKTIPGDVYNDGRPFFYQPNGKTYKLWSVGPDGVNNGGVPLERRPGDKGHKPVSNLLDNKGDFVAGLCR